MSYTQTKTLAASGADTIEVNDLSRAERHYVSVSGSGTVQCDFHVAGNASAGKTITVTAGSPLKVSLPDVTKIMLAETSTISGATVTISGR